MAVRSETCLVVPGVEPRPDRAAENPAPHPPFPSRFRYQAAGVRGASVWFCGPAATSALCVMPASAVVSRATT